MAPARRQSSGRSPLVNPRQQITAFFTKSSPSQSQSPSSSSPSVSKPNPNPSSAKSVSKLNPKPMTASCGSPTTPSPLNAKSQPKTTSTTKPLLVIGGGQTSFTTVQAASRESYGEEVLNRRIRVYWPLDKSWYEGMVKSFDKLSGKHLVRYDDNEEETLDLSKEKLEWLDGSVKKFKRLRKALIVDDDDEEDKGIAELEDDDSTDEDWEKSAVKEEVAEDCFEDMQLDDENDDLVASTKCKRGLNLDVKKRKGGELEKVYFSKKSKNGSAGDENGKLVDVARNSQEEKTTTTVNDHIPSDVLERFGSREAEKFSFLGKNRRDSNRRLPGDANYNPRTVYLPPPFLNGLSGGQRQWWEFKAKHMDKVLFFKVGKFYELYEMDAHVGVKELDLQYMKGEQPHCGFPEKNFSVNSEKLARKGYRVLVVEQTETPEQLEMRRKEQGSKDKVVKREICAIVTKGTITEGEMLSANPDAAYIMAITESTLINSSNLKERVYGVCVVDVATSRVIIGQIEDDKDCSLLRCLLAELRPVEIIKPAKILNFETETILSRCKGNPLVNELVPGLEFWDADKTVQEITSFYSQINYHFSEEQDMESLDSQVGSGKRCLPHVLHQLASSGEGGSFALSALGGALFYLKLTFLDKALLRYAKYELIPCSNLKDSLHKPYMVLDAAALENLEIFENTRNGGSSGTLFAQLNHCVTASGKRLLRSWLARPLYDVESIKERQDAVAGVKGNNLPLAIDFRKEISKLPDMDRLLTRMFASSEANGRDASKITLYEDAAKKRLQEFISALRGCEQMWLACSSLRSILSSVNSALLQRLLVPGKGLPDITSLLKHFKDAFDWSEANDSGRIIPSEGADPEYDSASQRIAEIERSLKKHLKEQWKLFGDSSIKYVTVGKDTYLLEVPESMCGSVPREYELRASKKGFNRYWSPQIKELLGELAVVESDKESKLKSILQTLIQSFCEHHFKWKQLVSTVAELDVLISLAIASDYYEGPSCRPIISKSSDPNEVPCLIAQSLGHPTLRSDSLGKGATFVPNDVRIGGSGNASFILLTGPNMGGKSTLLRQVCLALVLAQIGADAPAERFEMSLVDKIFVRMGAKDQIMTGQSTFLTELSETASMLTSATRNSVVALDELGRGTSTSDGQAIAESVLEHFVRNVRCRGMFSTHYHRLAVNYEADPMVSLCHMACQVGKSVEGIEEVTFLYRLTQGACPKSYGVNVARLAGIPDTVLKNAALKSRELEVEFGSKRKQQCSLQGQIANCLRDLIRNLDQSKPCIRSLTRLQERARTVVGLD